MGQHQDRFQERCFREKDLARSKSQDSDSIGSFACSWAAKEAFLKALGTDLRYIPYRDIELILDSDSSLSLNLYGVAAEAAGKAGVGNIRVSISHTQVAAFAVVVLEI